MRFADDIDLITETSDELGELTTRLHETSSAFGMEISEEKSKVMVTPRNKEDTDAKLNIKIGDIKLQQVREFKYLGAH